jgi:L-ascorbate metabolism protein UlaG (beta-lactamase superfamily)
MLLKHIGHAEFWMETENGTRIVTDPYDAGCGYPVKPVEAEIALISHHHHDHDAVENLQGNPIVIDQAGEYTPASGVRITAVRGYHDDSHGAKRGETLLFLIEADGLRIVHLGDLGDMLTNDQISRLKNPDILMIPVGGFYTIDGKQAAEIAFQLNAKVVLPMHYKTDYNADWPISGPEVFLEGYEHKDVSDNAEALRVVKEDLICQPKVVLFKP